MNEHSLTKLFLVTNMHLYINPKRGYKKILNFEQAHHFCSKQAVQKQWSLARVMMAIDMSLKTENDRCAVWVTNVDILDSIILGQNDAFKVKYLWLSSKQDC